jgi:hypothetical protein
MRAGRVPKLLTDCVIVCIPSLKHRERQQGHPAREQSVGFGIVRRALLLDVHAWFIDVDSALCSADSFAPRRPESKPKMGNPINPECFEIIFDGHRGTKSRPGSLSPASAKD